MPVDHKQPARSIWRIGIVDVAEICESDRLISNDVGALVGKKMLKE